MTLFSSSSSSVSPAGARMHICFFCEMCVMRRGKRFAKGPAVGRTRDHASTARTNRGAHHRIDHRQEGTAEHVTPAPPVFLWLEWLDVLYKLQEVGSPSYWSLCRWAALTRSNRSPGVAVRFRLCDAICVANMTLIRPEPLARAQDMEKGGNDK